MIESEASKILEELRNLPEPDTMVVAKALAELLYREYQKHLFHKDKGHIERDDPKGVSEPDYEYGRLLLDWTKEVFYGKLIKDILPVFDEVWNRLVELGHTSRKTAFDYGDYDVSTWAEKKGNRKILIYIRHCSMADDNTFIFIRDEPETIVGFEKYRSFFDSFKCVTVWPRQVNYPRNWSWQKGKAKLPSLATQRKHDFNWGYNDARDKGHVFKYEFRNGLVDNAGWTEYRILRAIEIPYEIRTAFVIEGSWQGKEKS